MSKRPQILSRVIELALRKKAENRPLKAIFDLDSTLFDVSPRITKILHAFSDLPEMKKQYPKECEFLSKISPHPGDYGVKKTLERCGFPYNDEGFLKVLVEFWKKQFFSSDFLNYDVPYPGAVNFVTDLCRAGADIMYLTGRDVDRMLKGSIASLKHYGFPINPGHANLVLKPSTNVTDHEFKKEFFQRMDSSFEEVWFFENEPANIHLVLEHCPNIRVIFVETVHSGKTPLPSDIVPRIEGFEVE